jgi:drug/metabolite transporter (DMT)-like permease
VPKWKTLALVLVVVILNAVGNLSLAWGMKHLASAVLFNPLSYIKAMSEPFVALGIILLILWLLTRMALLSWADLSFVLPLTGLGYILAAIFGNWFLNEKVTPIHWLGTILVFVGTGLVGMTTQKTHPGQESE